MEMVFNVIVILQVKVEGPIESYYPSSLPHIALFFLPLHQPISLFHLNLLPELEL